MSSQTPSPPSDIFSTLDLDKIKAELQKEGKIDCPTTSCKETFKSIWGLKFHLKKNTCNSPKFKCDKCNGAFQSRIILLQHACGVLIEGTKKVETLVKDVNKIARPKDLGALNKQEASTPCSSKEHTEETRHSHIVLPQHACGVLKEGTEKAETLVKDANEITRTKEIGSFNKQGVSTPCNSKVDTQKTFTSAANSEQKNVPKESLSNSREILNVKRKRGRTAKPKTPSEEKLTEKTLILVGDGLTQQKDVKPSHEEDTKKVTSTTKFLNQTPKETSNDNQVILNPNGKQGQPAKAKTNFAIKPPEEKQLEDSVNLREDCFMQKKTQDDSEKVSRMTNLISESPAKESDSNEQKVGIPKRRQVQSPNSAIKTHEEKQLEDSVNLSKDCFVQQKAQEDNENVGKITNQTHEAKESSSNEQNVLILKRKRGRPPNSAIKSPEGKQKKDFTNLGKDYFTKLKDQGDSERVVNMTKFTNETPGAKESSSNKQEVLSPKRKRGRPSKPKTSTAQTPKDSKEKEPVDLKSDSAVELKNVKPVTKIGRPAKVKKDSVITVRRTSYRSASKKVNYFESDGDDDTNTEDDDDADNGSDKSAPGSKVKKARLEVSGDDDDDSTDKDIQDDGHHDVADVNRPNDREDDKNDDDDDVDVDVEVEVVKKAPKQKIPQQKTPKAKQQKKTTEQEKLIASLKRQLKVGRISCQNNCGKKFASIAGYNFHLEICGKEKRVISCELCEKVYTTQAGLKYHMNSFHVEPEDKVEEKKSDEGEVDTQTTNDSSLDASNGSTSKRPRRAAARAIKKFQEIVREPKISGNPITNYGQRSSILDPYIKKLRPDLISPTMMEAFKDELRKTKTIVCPNIECQKRFTAYIGFHNHYLQCGFNNCPFECMMCFQGYNSIDGARNHVEKFHKMFCKQDEPRMDGDPFSKEQDDSVDESDVDYSKASDEESEEDYDDGDDNFIDDDDEDDDDDGNGSAHSDADDEQMDALDWDQDNERYNVEMGPRGKRNTEVLLYVGRWNQAFRYYEKWRKENVSGKEFFTDYLPTVDHWSRVKDSDLSGYIPTSRMSPHFRIVRPDILKHKNTPDTQLPVFTGLPKDDSGIHGDRTFYTGGPVWELSWCPTPDGERNATQYLVASTHKSFDTVFNAYECHKVKGLLQVWDLGSLSNTSSSSGERPTLVLGIAHEFGPIWKISWCPNGTWQAPQSPSKDNSISRLGLMAAACGDGVVRIISVPHPHQLMSKLGDCCNGVAEGTTQTYPYNKLMVHCIPQMELYPCSLNTSYNGQRGQATCVDWSQLEPYERLAAGFSDGTVAVWNLISESSLLRKPIVNGQLTSRLAPFVLIKAHPSLVRDLAFCPVNVDFIVTGGSDRTYRIWDLKSSMSPLFVLRKGFPYEIEWPLYSNGFVYCEDILYYNHIPSVRYFNIPSMEFRPLCQHASTVFTLSYNRWINAVASADVAGNVMCSKIMAIPKHRWHLYKAMIEDIDANGKSVDSPDDSKSSDVQNEANPTQKSRTLKEVADSSRIVFEDKNTLQFRYKISMESKEIKEKLNKIQFNCPGLESVHKVRWNPNKQALTWIASGGASGLVRIHQVRQVEPRHLKSAS